MNCLDLFSDVSRACPNRLAICMLQGDSEITFGQLESLSAKIQIGLRNKGVVRGSHVLLFEQPSPRMFATVLALLGLGASILLVEPWMPLSAITTIVKALRPQVFVAETVGKIWGAVCPAIRVIPYWISSQDLSVSSSEATLHIEQVEPSTLGIVSFTTGTTGVPKGVSRTHGYLIAVREILSRNLHFDSIAGSDLTIFANFVLLNLAQGRTSVVVPASWDKKYLKKVQSLSANLLPETLTCGPAFLKIMLDSVNINTLKHIHFGGANTDCALVERMVHAYPKADVMHIYGSSEAEPVAIGCARLALTKSREKGYFQLLFLGHKVPEIKLSSEITGLWVAGDQVCNEYVIPSVTASSGGKRVDAAGVLWHQMGDRVSLVTENKSDVEMWYEGRIQVARDIFMLEQSMYSALNSSDAFVHADKAGNLFAIVSSDIPKAKNKLRSFSNIRDVIVVSKIARDRRHRARIERLQTLRKEVPWLVG